MPLIPDFKLPLPITVIATIVISIGSGLIGMHTGQSVLNNRVDTIEKAVALQQAQMQSLTSRNEFLQFREDLGRQLADIAARVEHIDSRVSSR